MRSRSTISLSLAFPFPVVLPLAVLPHRQDMPSFGRSILTVCLPPQPRPRPAPPSRSRALPAPLHAAPYLRPEQSWEGLRVPADKGRPGRGPAPRRGRAGGHRGCPRLPPPPGAPRPRLSVAQAALPTTSTCCTRRREGSPAPATTESWDFLWSLCIWETEAQRADAMAQVPPLSRGAVEAPDEVSLLLDDWNQQLQLLGLADLGKKLEASWGVLGSGGDIIGPWLWKCICPQQGGLRVGDPAATVSRAVDTRVPRSHVLGPPQISASAVEDSAPDVDPSPTPSTQRASLHFPASGLSEAVGAAQPAGLDADQRCRQLTCWEQSLSSGV
ncbi:uncharacterized protein LOC134384086 [Cynocephalus volans]|uniref:uncharacterized protein LOC134384086 n=1 Tax=Cynocephalus volans TaxID=110931 RepID=UPI002FCA8CE2